MEIFILLIILVITTVIFVWTIYMIIGDAAGAPFVTVDDNVLVKILEQMKLKKGSDFWDLGSGNGKAVFLAVRKYGTFGYGTEINPLLVLYCRIKAGLSGSKKVKFEMNNLFKTDISRADYIYFYLFKGTVEKVSQKLEKECRPGTMVASRGFEIFRWKNRLTRILETNGWKTYFYKV